MKIVGIVAEYNPFHKGHEYQVSRARELSGADCVLAVMSGSFVQRGEAAVCSKWARAEMALCSGVDLVAELPVVYSAQSAEYFATGAVRILDAAGADYISFGAETEDLGLLSAAAELLAGEPQWYREKLAEGLRSGMSFPAARSNAAGERFAAALSEPNNILGIEYLKAMLRGESAMEPVPVLREGSRHDGEGSASHIRSISPADAAPLMPPSAHGIYMREVADGRAPMLYSVIEAAAMSRLRLISAEELSEIAGVSEGLENRIKAAARACTGLDTLADAVKTKRYTHSRIRRIAINALLGIARGDVTEPPEYLRILGMTGRGAQALRKIKRNCSLPIIIKTANAKPSRMLSLDMSATDIFNLAFPKKEHRAGGADMTTSPIVIS